MSNKTHRHVDQSEIDKQARLREQRRDAMADKGLTIALSLVAVAVVGFLIWSFVAD